MRANNFASNFSSKLTLRSALIIVTVVCGLLSGYLLIFKAAAHTSTPAPLASDSETDHYLYYATYTVKEGWTSTLVLNNPLNRAQNVRVTLYNRHGEALAVPEISLASNENLYFNIADWLTASGGDNFAEGSLEIFFHGRAMGIGGQLVVTDENHSLSFDVPFVEGGMFASSRLESLWWSLDGQSTAKIFLSNMKTERMVVTPTFYVNARAYESVPIALESHESKALDIGQALSKLNVRSGTASGGITLKHDRPPGALAVAGTIINQRSGFSTTMRFIDVRAQHSTKLHGAHLLIGQPDAQAGFAPGTSFAPRVTIRNTFTRPVNVKTKVLYTTKDGSRTVKLIPATLAAQEVRELNMSPVIIAVGTQKLLDAGIEIEHTGRAGAIVAAISSVDRTRNQVFDTPLRDPKSPSLDGGSYPFRIDGDNLAVIHLKNIDSVAGNGPRLCEVHLRFDGLDYTLPAQRVGAGETLAIDIKRLRDEQIPDGSGNLIPLDAAKGQVTWYSWGALGKFVGRLAQYNPALGTASSFSCPQPCECNEDVNTTVANPTYIEPDRIDGFAGESFELSAWEKRGHCGTISKVRIYGVTFKTSNAAIVSINGDIATLGLTAGIAKVSATWTTSVYYGTTGGCPVDGGPAPAAPSSDILPPECDPVECEYLPKPGGGDGDSQVTNIRIDLTQDGTRITNTTRNVIVGEKINLATEVAPTTTVISSDQWTVPGNRIANYVANNTIGAVTPLTNLTNNTVNFYWVDGGDGRQVIYSGTANGRAFTRKATFNVKRPTAQITTSTGLVNVDNLALKLRYGTFQTPGITFSSTLTMPAGFSGGRRQWVQTASPLRRRRLNNGVWQRWTGAGLDTQYPYWIGDATNDTPETPLENTFLEVSVNDGFEMWLMYQPDLTGAIWVPLRKLTWSWSGAASRGSGDIWTLNSSGKTVTPAVDTTTFPIWTRNAASNVWVNE